VSVRPEGQSRPGASEAKGGFMQKKRKIERFGNDSKKEVRPGTRAVGGDWERTGGGKGEGEVGGRRKRSENVQKESQLNLPGT